jgi:hypothetical protein
MNVINRIKKLERQRQPRKSQTVWSFEKTTDEQLLRLESLLKSGETAKAAEYSEQLINSGFLSYRIVEV